MRPHTRTEPCPVCDGHRDMPQGQGVRCWGATAADRSYAHCTRDELAGAIQQHAQTGGYPHRLAGKCDCGATHGGAEITPIGSAAREIVAIYDYRSADGAIVYQVLRYHPKTFRQRRPIGAHQWSWSVDRSLWVPYRLPELLAAVAAGDTVWIVEGEKDADAMHAAGHVATCNPCGAGKWPAAFARHFTGASVVIVRDKDDPGTKHARDVFRSLRLTCASIRVVEARAGKDAADHLKHGHTAEQFVGVWPAEDLRQTDPVAWKRREIRLSIDTSDPLAEVSHVDAMKRPDEPSWPTGLGSDTERLPCFRGVVLISGVPSAGKSFLALASAIDAARFGWDVLYLSAEMADRPVAKRIDQISSGEVPERFTHVDVRFGVTVEGLLDWVEARVSERPTLVVIDSLSSFADQFERQNENDPHAMGILRRIVMWAINVRRRTDGNVSFILLSESNKEGRAKGRFADHKADLALTMSTSADHSSVKEIEVTKSWEHETGALGEFGLSWVTGRMSKYAP